MRGVYTWVTVVGRAERLVTDEDEFARLTEPFRRELTVHCYRMSGSAQDAKDLVQEAYLRAWRGFRDFAGRSSVRVWLYRIATNVCLTALARRRRDLPAGLGAPGGDTWRPPPLAGPEVAWVTPFAGGVAGEGEDPAAVVAGRGSVRLALVAALQHLPATQRAVLLLRDVLGWRASEVADLLDTSTDAVHSLLARARERLRRAEPDEDSLREPPPGQAQRRLLDGYARAFADADVDGLLKVLRADVALEMPPHLSWFAGRDTVGEFLTRVVFPALGRTRLEAVTVNGGPGFAVYHGEIPHAVQAVTVTGQGIARIVSFNDPALFTTFNLSRGSHV
ncbi:sigma-70 family RNA polymerase sigma factor [Dactylosporangium darangshiense]|uniref:Sigma-70 family RNA polymerase sigma factor n=1 Tax=Dactylosporangium darangshiense TaxID=579108 RepID=A0ABP8DRX7_9ACTN